MKESMKSFPKISDLILKFIYNALGWLLLFLIAPLANAGSVPVSSSSIEGFFLGSMDSIYLRPDLPTQYLHEIKTRCENGGRIWALGNFTKFKCIGFTYIEEGGDGPVYELKVESSRKIANPSHAILFSLKPFANDTWQVRHGTSIDVDIAKKYLHVQGSKYTHAIKSLSEENLTVIDTQEQRSKIYLVPWKISSDGIVDEQDFLILVQKKVDEFKINEARGKVVGYVDLNNDGIPEIQISMKCDGACESVVSVQDDLITIVSISNH
jgi:hypothetical protein